MSVPIQGDTRRDKFIFNCKLAILLFGIGMLVSAAYIAGYSNGLVDGAMKAFDYVRTNFRCLIPFP